ncbi:MAG: mechanosensitive ion channel [Candidatus Dadabacteria bacterium]|nr:mechanosensitive ion channel [Candidatus Dadabacteria bacterium]MXZ13134.1 mechanosensitive ion channel [Candidatus Dadabacteria bacterium]MYA48596.1 mechanosensitive ion channel [Candidatus Dadabacteria bacterium]MYC40533.1 mechanosensitive ion channel [Candidatus Dadabacteria bacterium]MYF48463.1 mechanosensitive ion channel [Candidatus Dadabacteria bacterium]
MNYPQGSYIFEVVENLINHFREYHNAYSSQIENLLLSILIVAGLLFLRRILISLISKNTKDPKTVYHSKRIIGYSHAFLLIILLGSVWIKGFGSIGTYLGIASAGIAIALHETIANIAGWFFILWRKPFVIGDRIQIGDTKGDVIDLRLFQFSLVEIGNWVEAEQSTGRIIHVPNSHVLKERTANYHGAFNYIWNEIHILVTFESNWGKTREILEKVAKEKIDPSWKQAEQQLHLAAERYMIHFSKLTPAVYMSARESGVLFSVRYMVNPRQKRSSEQTLWEAILSEFKKHSDVELAYPTTRFYTYTQESTDKTDPAP